jgi:hypothetical protein
MLSYDCHLPFSGRFAFHFRSPRPGPASFSLCSFSGSPSRWKLLTAPRLLVNQYPLSSGVLVGRPVALPSSRVVPLNTCPDLRPRWIPDGSPDRLQDCCLPLKRLRRLSQTFVCLSFVHNVTYFGALSHGLCSRSVQFHTSIAGFACGFCY